MDDRTIDPTARPILVTGGTGTLGRHVVARLRDRAVPVRVLSRGRLERPPRRNGGEALDFVTADLATGEGIDAALVGNEVIVHLAGSQKGDEEKTRNLVRAAQRAGSRHLVYISVVGADRIPIRGRIDRAMFGYFGEKRAAEQVVAESGLPWTTLRATQFHSFALTVAAGMARLPIVMAPAGWRFQPIDARDVADRLVELALGSPAGLAPELGGPRIYDLEELVRSYLRATGKRRPIVSMPLPGAAARAFRDGANLTPDRAVGTRSWDEFLAERLSARRPGEPAPVRT